MILLFPIVFLVAFCVAAAYLILLGIGIAIGSVSMACTAVIIALGILFSSTLIALCQRRFSAGLRAFYYQFWAMLVLPAGVLVMVLGSAIFGLHPHRWYILFGGAVVGVIAGLSFALATDLFARFAYCKFVFKPSTLHSGFHDQ